MLIGAAFWFLLSVVLFMVSAQIQKGKLNGDAADAARWQPVPGDLAADDPGDRHRRTSTRGARRERQPDAQEVHGGGVPGRPAPQRLPADPGRHAAARPGRGRRLREALDPQGHAGRDPGSRVREDQLRLRERRRGAADRDRRGVPGDRRRPRDHPRLRGVRRLHRRDRRGQGQPHRSPQVEGRRRRRARRNHARASIVASTRSTASRRSPSPAPARTCATPPRATSSGPSASSRCSRGSRAG